MFARDADGDERGWPWAAPLGAWAWPATPRRFAREEKQAGADRATIDPPVYFSGTMSHDGRVSMGRRERTTFQVVYSRVYRGTQSGRQGNRSFTVVCAGLPWRTATISKERAV